MQRSLIICLSLLLTACLMQSPPAPPDAVSPEADRLLMIGLSELLENRPPASFDTLFANHPRTRQADLATRLLAWKRQRSPVMSPAPPPAASKAVPGESELRELKEENRRLRGDLEQLRRLLIESERRAR